MEQNVHSALIAITDMGDSALLAGVGLTLFLCLFIQGGRRDALVLLAAFMAAILGIGLVKILLMSCGGYLRQYGLRSPSGHSCLSLVVFGSTALLINHRIHDARRHIILILAISLACMIALSRVILGFHTKGEVLSGLLIGGIVLVAVRALLTKNPSYRVNLYIMGLALVAVAFLLHGIRLPAEHIIELLASHFRSYAHCAG